MRRRVVKPKLTKKKATQKAIKDNLSSRVFSLSGFQICKLYSKASKLSAS